MGQRPVFMEGIVFMKKKANVRDLVELVMNGVFFLMGMTAIAFVALITVYMFVSGLPAIAKIGPVDFLLGRTWASTAAQPSYGILPFILTSFFGTLGAVLIGIPVGLLTSVFLSKIAFPRMAALVSSAVELLAGIPSVIYGLIGMVVLVPAVASVFGLASGACMLTAILVLAAITTLLCKKINLPSVLGYILAGFLVGPVVEFIIFSSFARSASTRSSI